MLGREESAGVSMDRVRRLLMYAKHHGVSSFLKRVVRRLIRPIYEACVLNIYCLEALPVPAKPGIPADLVRHSAPSSLKLSAGNRRFRHRWKEGHVCYAATVGEKTTHLSWLALGGTYIEEIHLHILLPSNDGYVYDSFTDLDYRGLGLFPFVLSEISARLCRSLGGSTWIAVEEADGSSARAIRKAGFHLAGSVYYTRWLWLERYLAEGNLVISPADRVLRPSNKRSTQSGVLLRKVTEGAPCER